MGYLRDEINVYESWLKAVNDAWDKNWRCESGWVFISPSGSKHDLSAADLNQLSRIEREGLFLIQNDNKENQMR
jgi:hypothetical protein